DLSAIGRAPGDSLGLGHFAASSLNGSGLDSLVLRGTVQFLGDVTLNLNRRLSVADAGVLFADRAVSLSAPYVALGKAFAAPVAPQQIPPPFTVGDQAFYFSPAFGSGRLSVDAKLIDIGNLSLQNIGAVNFTANNGDIRGDGTVDVAGAISMTAGQ